jgi:hypothetical protein
MYMSIAQLKEELQHEPIALYIAVLTFMPIMRPKEALNT